MKIKIPLFFFFMISVAGIAQEKWKFFPTQTAITHIEEIGGEIWFYTNGGIIKINKENKEIKHANVVSNGLSHPVCLSSLYISPSESYLLHSVGFSIKRHGGYFTQKTMSSHRHLKKASRSFGVWNSDTLIYSTWDSLYYLSRNSLEVLKTEASAYATLSNYNDTSVIYLRGMVHIRTSKGLVASYPFNPYFSIDGVVKLDAHHNPWLFSRYFGLYALNGSKFDTVKVGFLESGNFKQLSNFHPVSDQLVWLAVWNWEGSTQDGGIYKFNPRNNKVEKEGSEIFEKNSFNFVLQDKKGQVWAVDELSNIYFKLKGSWKKIDLSEMMFPHSQVSLIKRNNEGLVYANFDNWNSTSKNKKSWLYKITSSGFEKVLETKGEQRIVSFTFDNKDSLYVRLTDKIIGPNDIEIPLPNTLRKLDHTQKVFILNSRNSPVVDFLFQNLFDLEYNVGVYENGAWKLRPIPYQRMEAGQNGKHWLIGGHLTAFDGNDSISNVHFNDLGIGVGYVGDIMEDPQNILWFTTSQSENLYKFTNGKLDSTLLKGEYYLYSSTMAFGNRPEEIWLKNTNLFHIEGGHVTKIPYTQTPFLNFNEWISEMVVDKRNNIYFNSQYGIYVFNERGIDLPQSSELIVEQNVAFPNPFSDHFTIPLELSSLSATEISIFNAQGDLLKYYSYGPFEKKKIYLEVHLPNEKGLFIYRIKTGSQIHSGKIIGQ